MCVCVCIFVLVCVFLPLSLCMGCVCCVYVCVHVRVRVFVKMCATLSVSTTFPSHFVAALYTGSCVLVSVNGLLVSTRTLI